MEMKSSTQNVASDWKFALFWWPIEHSQAHSCHHF